MKTVRKITFVLVLAVFAMTSTGCFGGFQLTRKVYNWNDSVVESRFVKTLLFWGMNIIPIYGAAGAIDYFILNLVEYWTGSNPLAMAEGEHEYQIIEFEGNKYELFATKNYFSISKINGEEPNKLYSIHINQDKQFIGIVSEEDSKALLSYN